MLGITPGLTDLERRVAVAAIGTGTWRHEALASQLTDCEEYHKDWLNTRVYEIVRPGYPTHTIDNCDWLAMPDRVLHLSTLSALETVSVSLAVTPQGMIGRLRFDWSRVQSAGPRPWERSDLDVFVVGELNHGWIRPAVEPGERRRIVERLAEWLGVSSPDETDLAWHESRLRVLSPVPFGLIPEEEIVLPKIWDEFYSITNGLWLVGRWQFPSRSELLMTWPTWGDGQVASEPIILLWYDDSGNCVFIDPSHDDPSLWCHPVNGSWFQLGRIRDLFRQMIQTPSCPPETKWMDLLGPYVLSTHARYEPSIG